MRRDDQPPLGLITLIPSPPLHEQLAFNRGAGAPHPRGHKGVQGGLCLRYTQRQIEQLLLDLERHRPDRVEKLRARLAVA